MKKRKILWFCGAQFSEEKIKTTGTWLIAMGKALADRGDIELYNVTYGDVKIITQKNFSNITQWIIPHKETLNYKRGSKELSSFVLKINEDIKPDLIHIWGTEDGFGYTVIKLNLQTPILLDIQGLLFVIVKDYYGGLSKTDLIKCTGLKEIIRPHNHAYFIRKKFKARGKHELQLINKMNNISVQSFWVHSIIKYINSKSNIFQTGIMLRREFYESTVWDNTKNDDIINIFTSCSGPIPYKGLHVIFESIAILKKKYPNIKLNIGGNIQIVKKYGLIRDGYTSWMLRKITKLGIQDSITWLGMMSADEMIKQMRRSHIVVIPSFVETYSLFLAESMMIGVPTVASFVGGMPQMGEHGKSVLFFPAGDYWTCARQIERLISDPVLAKNLSVESRVIALKRNDQAAVLQTQLDIYNEIINKHQLL